MNPQKFVIFDRDGTLIYERHYLSDPTQVELIPGVIEGLKQLSEAGFGLIVVTNQSGIGRGYFDQARLQQIHAYLQSLLGVAGICWDGLYYCPHTPADECHCRKPQPGLIEQAAHDLGFDPSQSYVVGDKPCDIHLGEAVGAVTLLVRTGYGEKVADEGRITPNYVVKDVKEAADVILQHDSKGVGSVVYES